MPDAPTLELPKATMVAKEAAKGSAFIFAGNTLSTAILTIASVVMARLLGPSDYGLYSVALIAPNLMLLFTDFGVISALVRFTAKFKSEGRSESIGGLIKTGLMFQLAASLLMLLLTFTFSDTLVVHLLNRSGATSLINLSSLLIVGNVLALTSSNVFIGLDKMDKTAAISITQATIKVILAPILIILGFGIVGALTGHVLGYLIAGVIGAVMTIRISKLPRYTSDRNPGFIPNLTLMVRYGIPLYTSTLITGLLIQYQSVILAWFTMNVEIGNYFAAAKFLTAVMLLTTPISTVLFPAFSKLDPKHDSPDLRNLFTNSLKYTLLLLIPTTAFITVNSEALVALFYGSNYAQAPLYLTLYSITFFYMGFSLVLGSFFNGIGETNISLKATLVQLPVAILLVPILTWLYKVPGFLCALIISSMPTVAFLAWTAHNNYRLEFNSKCILKIYVATLLSSTSTLALALYLPYSPLIKLVLGALTFGLTFLTLAPIIGIIEPKDITNLEVVTKDIKLISKLSRITLYYESRILSLMNPRQSNN